MRDKVWSARLSIYLAIWCLLAATSLSACGGFAPTSAPTAEPNFTSAPTPDIGAIAVLQITRENKLDGTIRTNARLSTGSLGLGALELSYPVTLPLTETRSILLKINPSSDLVSLTPVPATTPLPNSAPFLLRYNDRLEIYPVMDVELNSFGFDIDPKGKREQVITANHTAEWTWLLKPRAAGKHDVTLEISIPVIVDGIDRTMSTQSLKNIPFTIEVSGATGANPAPTPAPLLSRIGDNLASNFTQILIALISSGGLIGFFIKYYLDKRDEKIKAKEKKPE